MRSTALSNSFFAASLFVSLVKHATVFPWQWEKPLASLHLPYSNYMLFLVRNALEWGQHCCHGPETIADFEDA